jgi:magnesium-transporting ATPase (P-type)
MQTNYNTLRGKYLRAIRYQKKQQENFTRETIYFIYILIFITTIGFLAILPTISEAQTGWSLFITYLDLLSDSIPMTLPTALSVGIKFAQHRLRKHNIDLVLPSNILAGGRANSIVLDSCKAFGKDYEVESIMVGTKNKRGFGNTYTSMTDFL